MAGIDDLPFQLAIRTVMDEVWYSNALPEWYTPQDIDRTKRVARLRDRARGYTTGDQPIPVLRTQVPRLTGGFRTWGVPAVNDQMIMQACVAQLKPEIAKTFDRKRTYSHAPNDNPSSVALMKPQIPALIDFYTETIRRLQGGAFVLEFDIERAFASIDRAKFFEFLEGLKPKSLEVTLIQRLLDSWSGADPGIPMVNDSVFFLGGAYLNIVDREVSKSTSDYIRYVDDYRVFGSSRASLETTFEKISRNVAQLGLRMNPRKVRIGSAADILDPQGDPRFITQGSVIELDSGMIGNLDPEQLAKFIGRSLDQPTYYLTEGIGRYLLGSLRRYRLNRAIYRRAKEDARLADRLFNALTGDSKALEQTGIRLGEYGSDPENAWRAIWIIYLIEQQGSASTYTQQLSTIEKNARLPEEVRLWSRRCRLGLGGEPEKLSDDNLHDISYLEAGRRCYGEQVCKGEGF
jgi:reverse transcriptase-like protein